MEAINPVTSTPEKASANPKAANEMNSVRYIVGGTQRMPVSISLCVLIAAKAEIRKSPPGRKAVMIAPVMQNIQMTIVKIMAGGKVIYLPRISEAAAN